MTSETVVRILKCAPHVRCFAIGSDELAKRQCEHAVRALPRLERKQAVRRAFVRWRNEIEAISALAKEWPYERIVDRLQSLPLEAVRLAFDATTADRLIDEVAKELSDSTRRSIGIGICENFLTEAVVIIWLWKD